MALPIPTSATSTYFNIAYRNYIEQDNFLGKVDYEKLSQEQLIAIYDVSRAVRHDSHMVLLGKQIVKKVLTVGHETFVEKFPILRFIDPKNISIKLSHDEWLYILKKDRKNANPNIYMTIAKTMFFDMIGDKLEMFTKQIDTVTSEMQTSLAKGLVDETEKNKPSFQIPEGETSTKFVSNELTDAVQKLITKVDEQSKTQSQLQINDAIDTINTVDTDNDNDITNDNIEEDDADEAIFSSTSTISTTTSFSESEIEQQETQSRLYDISRLASRESSSSNKDIDIDIDTVAEKDSDTEPEDIVTIDSEPEMTTAEVSIPELKSKLFAEVESTSTIEPPKLFPKKILAPPPMSQLQIEDPAIVFDETIETSRKRKSNSTIDFGDILKPKRKKKIEDSDLNQLVEMADVREKFLQTNKF